MKAIDLALVSPSLAELLLLASEDNVILRTTEGRQFVLAEIDDFAEEIAAVNRNESLRQLLDDRSREQETVSLQQIRDELRAKPKGRTRRRDSKP